MADSQVPTPPKRRFFDDSNEGVQASAQPYGAPRALTGASEVLNLKNTMNERGVTSAWQSSAWDYVDQIGELKFAFNLAAQIVSRAYLYPAVIVGNAEVPVPVKDYLADLAEKTNSIPPKTDRGMKVAEEAVTDLVSAGEAEILRRLSLNLSIPGECYLIKDSEWIIASTDEFFPGTPPYIVQSRSSSRQNKRNLAENAYAARIWRPHPRYYRDADSSMLGVLDSCEKIILFDQEARANSRSRLGAGVILLPNGVTAIVEGKDLMEALSDVTVTPVETETSTAAITPLILQGPAEAIKEVQRIDLGRPSDPNRLAEYEAAIDRMLAGVDIPKDVVSGLADIKFSNALVVDDALYKAHIEPLLLLICDALTSAYLRPQMLKEGVDPELVRKMVIWYDPSQIVTRPDRSQAATEGYDKYLLSGSAWRTARGFTENDAPSEDEIIMRLATEKAPIPTELATVLIEAIHPVFFAKERQRGQAESGVPADVSEVLEGNTPTPADLAPEPLAAKDQQNGGEITPGGTLPPFPEGSEEYLT